MVEVKVFVEVDVNPTEEEDKVRFAVKNLFDGVSFTVKSGFKGNVLTAEAKGQSSLVKMRNLIRNDRIRDAARRILHKSVSGNMICFFLNKQVAFAGHVCFSEETSESPLGPIKVTVKSDDPHKLIDWLAEKTVK